jgi:hypothetical protein
MWSMLWGLSVASAAPLEVDTAVPVELRLGETVLLQTWGPARLVLPSLEPGVRAITVIREGKPVVVEADLKVPSRLKIDRSSARMEAVPLLVPADEEAPAPIPPPALELRPKPGHRFAVLVDGQRLAIVGPMEELRIDWLGNAEHRLELRSPDLTRVYSRGRLQLQDGDVLVLSVEPGLSPQVLGPGGGWHPDAP